MKKWIKWIAIIFIGLAVANIIIATNAHDYSDRVRVLAVLEATKDARNRIGGNLLDRSMKFDELIGFVPGHVVVKEKDNEVLQINYKKITKDGELLLYVSGAEVFLFLKPSISESEITWECGGWPIKKMPANCRK